MKEQIHKEHEHAYPGAYEPLPANIQALNHALNDKTTSIVEPPAYLEEYEDHYRIGMPAPGFTREDFFIEATPQSLTIAAIIKEKPIAAHSSCIKKEIVLPDDVDPEFATATYVNGVLQVCLFKTNFPLPLARCQIVVY